MEGLESGRACGDSRQARGRYFGSTRSPLRQRQGKRAWQISETLTGQGHLQTIRGQLPGKIERVFGVPLRTAETEIGIQLPRFPGYFQAAEFLIATDRSKRL